jgi:hypothetical protein
LAIEQFLTRHDSQIVEVLKILSSIVQHAPGSIVRKLPASSDFGIPALRSSVDLLRSFFAEASAKIRIQHVDGNR